MSNSILTAMWHILTHEVNYHDLGRDYLARHDPECALQRSLRQANTLEFTVRFDSIQAA